jgi:hypothetical protein
VDQPFTVAGVTTNSGWDGSVNADSPLTVTAGLTMGSGTFGGSAAISLAGASQWTAGSLSMAAGATLTNNGTLTLSSPTNLVLGGTLTNNGTINETGAGNLFIGDNSTLTNGAGAFYNLQSDAGLTTHLNGTFVNASGGTYQKSGGGGTSSNDCFFTNNGGAIAVSSGNLKVQFATYSGTSTFNAVNSGNVLDIAGASDGGEVCHATGTLTGSGSGHVVLTSRGELDVGSGGATFSFPAGYFQWQGGTINGGSSGLTVAANKFLTLSGADTKVLFNQLNNAGTIVQTEAGNLNIADNSTLTNQGTGVYDLQSDAGITTHLNGTFVNQGIFQKSGVSGTNTSALDSFFSNPGLVLALAGTLAINFDTTEVSGTTLTGGTWEVFGGATLTLNRGVNLTTNNATVVLDGPGSAFTNLATLAANGGTLQVLDGAAFTTAGDFSNTGTLTIGLGSVVTVSGNYTQQDPNATLEVQLGGTADTGLFGQLQVNGTANLGGALQIDLVNGYAPNSGDSFTILTDGSRNGDFASLNLPAGAVWDPNAGTVTF